MENNKFEIILNSLLNRTRNDELNWKTTASSSIYLLVLRGSSITIDKLNDRHFLFGFQNEKGETVEGVTISESNNEHFSKVTELYNLARRKALKSDDTIDKIIKQLNPESLAA